MFMGINAFTRVVEPSSEGDTRHSLFLRHDNLKHLNESTSDGPLNLYQGDFHPELETIPDKSSSDS